MGITRWFPTKALRAGSWRLLGFLRWLKVAPSEQHLLRRVGYLRHVQNVREVGARRNPDNYAGHFMTAVEKTLARLEDIERVRKNPLFHYVLARTRFYDRILSDAIAGDFKQLVILGVGTDTRSFRFREALDRAGVSVFESDLQPWLSQRKRLSQQIERPRDFHQIEFDLEQLNDHAWTDLTSHDKTLKTLFIAEGVTPYISQTAHRSFLRWVSNNAPVGSRLAYDAKFVRAGNKRADGVDSSRFRMSRDPGRIVKLHDHCGLDVMKLITSADAQKKLTPYEAPIFDEDIFVTVAVQ